MALSCIILEIKRNISQKSWFFHTILAFDAPVRGSPSDCCLPVWFENTRMMVYPTMKKVWRYVYPFCTNVTDRQTDTAWRHKPRLMQASLGKNTVRKLQNKNVQAVTFASLILTLTFELLTHKVNVHKVNNAQSCPWSWPLLSIYIKIGSFLVRICSCF